MSSLLEKLPTAEAHLEELEEYLTTIEETVIQAHMGHIPHMFSVPQLRAMLAQAQSREAEYPPDYRQATQSRNSS